MEVLAYCLLTNHVHLVAIPHAQEALAQALGRTHFRYTQYINRFYRRSGRFASKLETLLGRRVRPLPAGRPRKTPEGDAKIKRKRT